jgi:hypothetical protein
MWKSMASQNLCSNSVSRETVFIIYKASKQVQDALVSIIAQKIDHAL